MLTSSNVKSNFKPGDIMGVRPGYAKHFLIPRGLALRVKGNEQMIQDKLDTWKQYDESARAQSALAFKSLNDTVLSIEQKSGVGGSLYGSISPRYIAQLISTDALKIHASDVHMERIKLTGTYPVKVKLYGGARASLTLEVKPQS